MLIAGAFYLGICHIVLSVIAQNLLPIHTRLRHEWLWLSYSIGKAK